MKNNLFILFFSIILFSCNKETNKIRLQQQDILHDYPNNISSELIEHVKSLTDKYNNPIFTFKQELSNPDDNKNRLSRYYTQIYRNEYIRINDSFNIFISDVNITGYNHQSRQYDGAEVDVQEFELLLKNGINVNIRTFSIDLFDNHIKYTVQS